MRISDWSSDVCSSDLPARLQQAPGSGEERGQVRHPAEHADGHQRDVEAPVVGIWNAGDLAVYEGRLDAACGGQLAGLVEEGHGEVEAGDRGGAEILHREQLARAVAAELRHRLAGEAEAQEAPGAGVGKRR